MNLDELLTRFSAQPESAIRIPKSWGHGRTTFGGLVASVLYQAMEQRCAPDRSLRSMAVTFVGPLAVEQDAVFTAEILRQGKAVSQMEAKAIQGGNVMAAAMASFGAPRESTVNVEPASAPSAPSPEACRPVPYVAGVSPEFIQQMDIRWAFGGLPYSNTRERSLGGWMRLRDPAGPIGPAHLIALIDAWPPAVLPHLAKFAPSSTMTWTFEIMQPQPELKPEDWLLYRAEIDQAGDGYGQTSAGIWTAGGQLVAMSRQTVTVFG